MLQRSQIGKKRYQKSSIRFFFEVVVGLHSGSTESTFFTLKAPQREARFFYFLKEEPSSSPCYSSCFCFFPFSLFPFLPFLISDCAPSRPWGEQPTHHHPAFAFASFAKTLRCLVALLTAFCQKRNFSFFSILLRKAKKVKNTG